MAKAVTQHELSELKRYLREIKARECEALRLYEPLPWQEKYHATTAKECIAAKGNQVGGAQTLDSKVLTTSGWKRIADVKVGDLLFSSDGQAYPVSFVFPVKDRPAYRMVFDDGASCETSGDHNWKCKLTKKERFPSDPYYDPDLWRVCTTDDIIEFGGMTPKARKRAAIPLACFEGEDKPLPLDPYAVGALLGDGCTIYGAVLTTGDPEIAVEVAKGLPPHACEIVKSKGKDYEYRIRTKERLTTERGHPCNPVVNILRDLGIACGSYDKFIPQQYLEASVDQRLALLQGLMDTDGYCNKKGSSYFYTNSPTLSADVVTLVRGLGGKAYIREWKKTYTKQADGTKKRVRDMAVVSVRLPGLIPYRLERKIERHTSRENLRRDCRTLHKIEPLGVQPTLCIQVDSPDHTYITDNYIVTHNSLAGFAEVARAVTGQDPYNKYPKENGVAVCLGYGEPHIGRVMHRYLFRYGAFDIIRDKDTNEWRTFRPWPQDEEVHGKYGDKGREDEAKPAPPLIPKRFIKGKISWLKRSENIFSTVYFTTGWTLYALNSMGDPSRAQGFQANLYHIDEDVATGGWYSEAVGRCSRHNGLIRWTAMPHSKTEDIVSMMERGEEEEGKESPKTVVVRAGIDDNPFLPPEAKEENLRIWKDMGEDVLRMRAYGELTVDSVLMYPRFDPKVHTAVKVLSRRDKEAEEEGKLVRCDVQRIMDENNGVPPKDWCRYFSFDPGHQVLAGVAIAVPPAHVGNFKVVYDELYITAATAVMFGDAMYKHFRNDVFQDWIVDMHGARLRQLGSGELPIRDYERAIDSKKMGCEVRGSRFGAGCDDIKLRENKLRNWMSIREDGFPTLLIVNDRCPNLIKELKKFKKKKTRVNGMDVVTDEANRRGMCHAIEALEMLAAHGCPFVSPPVRIKSSSRIRRIIEEQKMREKQRKRKRRRPGGDGITLGPLGDSE